MNKIKTIIIVVIGITIILITFKHIIKKTPTDIENVNLYEKIKVLKLLKKEYPEDKFEIICYLSDINKSPSKWSPSERKVGKNFMVRPNGQVGEEFLVKYYDNDEDKFFSTPIKPIIKAYYKDEDTVTKRRADDMLEKYIQPILDENLKGKERFKDYNLFCSSYFPTLIEWFKSIKNIDDYFYTEPDDEFYRYRKIIAICIYINEDEFNEEELYFYYDCFQRIANELVRKIDYEKSSTKEYTVHIELFRIEQKEFNNIKSLDSQTLDIFHEKLRNNMKFHWYYKTVNIENGEIIDKDETSFKFFQDVIH